MFACCLFPYCCHCRRPCSLLIWFGTLAKAHFVSPTVPRAHDVAGSPDKESLSPRISDVEIRRRQATAAAATTMMRRGIEDGGEKLEKKRDGDGEVKPLLSNAASGNMESGVYRVYNKGLPLFASMPQPKEEADKQTRRQHEHRKDTSNSCKEGAPLLWTTKRMIHALCE
ncbi:hypothetical protein MGYG_08987 [Nannizzia gypsea CBS 118893]|uniref:Uncharacterized protein n=1 Tax=Arthroderma gypseum (strain ATCC MYA-4604 / CBS 118893) TaxID=535722 RepID=E4UN03_ARTGP|nr:hypothetical protein MGYG_08987 [Nannizzia gypsea CBS 118893]EFQ99517.1 hypothetical protein MGYG_08987 [Nannizzia gypsea CBS 118893]